MKQYIITNNFGQYLKVDYGFDVWTTTKCCATFFTNKDAAERKMAQHQNMAFPKKLIVYGDSE